MASVLVIVTSGSIVMMAEIRMWIGLTRGITVVC